ncbi:hypothetical protein [Rhizobium rosettiformans]|uniref:hypothetical protein n=1 Tax=Rhizobium rosettiformans TaxID=1368430 RepID=UPI002855A490|nr:hypothetical protein [Rhizobium rosettiformans]MDR7030955.1 hypothetical protein [Rhizobium rosettiformans]MDR7066826.1 hypothetical protein [Rhizobium rosettiformans]
MPYVMGPILIANQAFVAGSASAGFRRLHGAAHLAESVTAAELRIAKEGYRNARLEIFGSEDGDRAGGAESAA